MTDQERASALTLLPIKNTVLFPNMVLPLVVGRAGSIAALNAAMATEDKRILIFAQKDATVENPQADDLFRVGVEAIIKKMTRTEQAVEMFVQGVERVELIEIEQSTPFLKARVRVLPAPDDDGPEVEALHRTVLEQVGRIETLAQAPTRGGFTQLLAQIGDPLHQVYLLGSMIPLTVDKEQALLQASTRAEALKLMHDYLTEETQVLEVRQKIASQVETKMGREQREYLLRQQMRAIQDELGERNPEQEEVDELRERLDEAELPEEARKEADRELARLGRLSAAAPDYQLTRSYLELLAELPWTQKTEDNLDLDHAWSVLDRDHYDLTDVKERIVEHLAVLKLNPRAKAPILCFVGPPGTGKTSLGQSIANALGRKFERMSLGGLHDEAELRGHRRTYIGAMPGRILQSIRRAQVRNPLLMLDEIDKLGQDFRGDPSAALMEILDPAQNFEFRDNYLNLPFDLSKVFFITTANSLETVPRALLDRMEVLRLAGYTEEEKVQIAHRYLIPRRLSEAGLTAEQLTIPDESLRLIIRRYTREAGLRELERSIGRLARKVAVRFATSDAKHLSTAAEDDADVATSYSSAPNSSETPGPATAPEDDSARGSKEAGETGAVTAGERAEAEEESRSEPTSAIPKSDALSVTVGPEDLTDLLGPERFFEEHARKDLPPGVTTGLAWTESGGDVLYIEALLLPSGKEMTLTGQLGKVMKESAQAANSYVWSQAERLGIRKSAFRDSGVHIHVPAGGIPKDGPSAGVAIATALASVYSGRPARGDTAMTGEITLTGLVLPIGGVKEKVLAASRADIHRIILPRENAKDLPELPDNLRDEMEFILVDRVEEVFEAALADGRAVETEQPELVGASG